MEKQKKGFALLSRERHQEIASMGGKAAHAKGKANVWTTEAAKAAAKKSQEIQKAKKNK